MGGVTVATRNGGSTTLEDGAIDGFRAGLGGELVVSGEAGYDEARALWNGMIDRVNQNVAPARA